VNSASLSQCRILCVRDMGHDRFSVELESESEWGEVELDLDAQDEGTELFVAAKDAFGALGRWVSRNAESVAEGCLSARSSLGGVWRPVRKAVA
jgi:hypothetical protein